MRKKLHLHSYKKNEFEELQIPKKSHEILKIPDDKIDVEVLAKKIIAERIENDEMNKLGFYEIVPDRFDISPQSKKNVYKSIHNPNESYLISMNKFYEKKNYNYMEKKIREELANKSGNKLLLNEIYNHLDENPEIIIKNKNKIEENIELFKYYKSETQNEMVNNLEKWQKNSQKRFSSLRNSTEILNIKVKNQIQIKDKNQSQLVEETNFSNQSLKLNNSVLKTDDYTFLPKIETKKKQLGEKISSSASFQKNSIHLPEIKRKESGKFNEENFQIEDDNLIESLKNKMHLFLSDNIEIDSFTKKSVLYSKIVDNIISKMNKRISFLETFLIKKNKNLLIFRTETSVILEKIQNLKTLIIELNQDLSISKQISLEMKKTKNSIDPPIKNLFSSSSNKEKKASLNESLQNSLNFKNKSLKNEEIELEINENDAKPEHKIQLTGDLNYYKQKHRFNKSLIQNTEETIKPRKKELKKLKKMRLEFLKNLLKKGKDFRNEGISWIIRVLWNLGEKIHDKQLPEFLDSKAKDFLFEKAKQEENLIENETFKKISLEIYKSNISKEETQVYDSFISKSFLKNEENNNISQEIINEQSELSSARKKLRDFKEDFLGLNIENNSIIEENPDTEIYFKSIEEKESDSNKIEEFDDVIELGKLPRKKYQANKEIFKNNIRMEETSPFNEKIKQVIYKDLDLYNDRMREKKQTIHDLIYIDTKKKIHEMVKSSIHQIDKTVIPYNDKSTLTFDISNLQNFDNYIMMYEDNSVLNNYINRDDFIQNYDNNHKSINECQKKLGDLIDEEVIRIFKEYGFQNYERRFKVDLTTVLCILFGAKRTNSELMKKGSIKK